MSLVVDGPDKIVAYADCPECHFYKNSTMQIGQQCRRIDCEGLVEAVIYVRLDAVLDSIRGIHPPGSSVPVANRIEKEFS